MKKTAISIVILLGLLFSCSGSELDLSNANLPVLNKLNDSIKILEQQCNFTPSLSAGSYPTKNPESLLRSDITDALDGVEVELTFYVSQNGTVMENYSVDLWHCNPKGKFSQYGEYNSSNYLRGRQLTSNEGKVVFKTLFPGWDGVRAPHMYLSIRDNEGTSVKITQITFTDIMQEKVAKNSNYTKLICKKLKDDKVFSDKINCVLPDKISGSSFDGYKIEKTIKIN